MVTTLHCIRAPSIKLEFDNEPVTSFVGLLLAERMATRSALWYSPASMWPPRRGFDRVEIVKSMTLSLLGGT